MSKVVILDFGSQYTQLIARRVRESGIYAEIMTSSVSATEIGDASGVIFSGGPQSVGSRTIDFDASIFELTMPLLGICFGMQLMNQHYGGVVKHVGKGEYGKQKVSIDSRSAIFKGLDAQQTVWMSHGDSIEFLSPHFSAIASSDDGIVAAIEQSSRPIFGVQFHPEVTHTDNGITILDNFLSLCHCQGGGWTMKNYLAKVKKDIQEKVGSKNSVVTLVSGGVDSTVATVVCREALGAHRILPLYIDTGLMRAGESESVCDLFHSFGITNLRCVDASDEFLQAIDGVAEPESKRKIIGELFIRILDREMNRMEGIAQGAFFCQGTLYTDLIESGKGCGQHAAVIKSHHNVSAPLVEEKRRQGMLIEPNASLFKDEVRTLGQLLEIPHQLLWRHPFPGPGLAVRILGAVTHEKAERLRRADAIFIEELRREGLYDAIWQAFAVLLPTTTVGVMGDGRTEGNVVALRAVTSIDGMTATFYPLPYHFLERCSGRIVNEVDGVNRVVYDITHKPPATIEWE